MEGRGEEGKEGDNLSHPSEKDLFNYCVNEGEEYQTYSTLYIKYKLSKSYCNNCLKGVLTILYRCPSCIE